MKLQGKIFTKLFALLLSVLLTLVATTLVVTTLIGAIPSYAALAESDDPPTPPAVSPYSVSLSPAPITFPAADEGYGAQKAQTVTITNTGSVATGSLSIAFSEGAASAFKLSKSSQTSIAIGKTGSFTVVPNTKLSAGTYTAAVKVSNGNVPPETIEVSFTVNPLHYEISLKPDVINFPAVDEGYGAQKAQTVTITNTGNAATGSLSIALSGGAASAFKLSKSSQTSIAIGKTGSFTVAPNTKLSAGTYSATITVSNGNVPQETVDVSFTVIPLRYEVSLNPDKITFPDVGVGYAAQKAQTVTITNTGNTATGALNISLGTGANLFTLSKSSQTSLAVGKTGTFTVTPKTGLGAGTHTASVTISNGAVPVKTVELSFFVEAIYSVSLTPDAIITFRTVKEGYVQQSPQTVTVKNTGNVPTGDLYIELSGANSDAFSLSADIIGSIAVGGSRMFTVKPNTGLDIGNYTAEVTVSNGDVQPKTVNASFTVIDRSLTPTYYVSAADGSDASGDGSAGKPWESVQFGVNKLAAGDMLIIREGVYKEKVSISVSGIEDDYIVIMGETGAILDGEGVSNSYNSEDWNSMITMNNVSYVRVENLEIRNFTPTSSSNAGILVEATKTGKSVGVQVVNNKIHDLNRTPGVPNAANKKHGHGIGVYGRGTAADGAVRELLIEGNEVYNCKLYQSETVVVNGNVSDWQIINNYIHDNDNIGIDAIGGEKTSSTTATDRARYGLIAGNVLVNNSSGAIGGNEGYKDKGIIDLCAGGIYVDGGRNIEIRDNYVERSDYGIEIAAENGTSYWPSGITVSNNVVVGCSQAGIGMGGDESVSKIGANDVLVEFNTIYCNKAAYGCIVRSGKNGPYTISKNIILVGNGTTYVWGSYGTAIYAGNVYFGGSSSIPSGDLTGQYVTTLPVASLVTSSPGWFEPVSGIDAGARLTPARTPFLDRVYD